MNSFKKDSRMNGSIFMAVLRGKISEGLDFSDSEARAVFIVGVPFAPIHDIRVKAKKDVYYLIIVCRLDILKNLK